MNEWKRKGMTLVISGPSGSGKSTLYHAVAPLAGGIEFSVSCTTRAPREGEKDGVDYYFISREEFEARVARGEFAEHAEVHGNFYGTLKSELSGRTARGADVVLDIDVQGADQLRRLAREDEAFRRTLEFVFVAPPSYAELERRLRARGTESEETLARRLANAKREMQCADRYDYLIVNDNREEAADRLLALIRSLRLSLKRMDPGDLIS